MKKYVFLFLTLLLLPLASAKVVYDSWHHSGDEFTVKNIEHSVLHEYGEDKVFITAGASSFIITPEKCAEVEKWEYCISEIDEDLDGDKVTYRDGKAYAGIKVKIEEIKPELSMQRSLSTTQLNLDETFTVTVTLENNGNRPIDHYVYRDYYPVGFRILDATNDQEEFIRQGNLGIGQKKTFQYSVKVNDFVDYTSQGNITYEYGQVEEFSETSSQAISVEKPYEVDFSVENSEMAVGEETLVELKVGSVEEALNASFELDFGGVNVVSSEGNLTEVREIRSWYGELEGGAEENFKIRIAPETTGEHNISLEVDFDVGEEDYSYSDMKTIKAELSGLEPRIELTPSEVNSESSIRLRVFLENEDLVQFEASTLAVSIFDREFDVPDRFVQPDNSDLVFERHVEAPIVKERTGYDAVFNGKYATSKQTFNFSTEETAWVLPKPKVLLVKLIAPDSVNSTEEFEVETVVSNKGENSIEVRVENKYGNETVNSTVQVPAGENESYVRSVSGTASFKDISLEASATLESANETAKDGKVVKVKTPEDVEDVEEQESIFTEETGFFTKVVDGIVNFVSWMFTG